MAKPTRRKAEIEKRPGGTLQVASQLVTLSIKITGIVLAVHEAFGKPPHDGVTLGLAAFMLAGATGLDSFFERLFKP